MDLHLRGLCLLFLLGSVTSLAQDEAADAAADDAARAAEIDEIGPGVGSDELETSAAESAAAPTALLASDVRRSTQGSQVMDELVLDRTEITGNQELPTVMYIVPWQKSDPGELMGKPVNTLLDEIMAPIDRSEFLRQVDYYDDLHQKDQ
jgi:hypothetical protein